MSINDSNAFQCNVTKLFFSQQEKVFFTYFETSKKLSFNFLFTFSLRLPTGTYGKLFLSNRKNFYNWCLKGFFFHFETFEKKTFVQLSFDIHFDTSTSLFGRYYTTKQTRPIAERSEISYVFWEKSRLVLMIPYVLLSFAVILYQ